MRLRGRWARLTGVLVTLSLIGMLGSGCEKAGNGQSAEQPTPSPTTPPPTTPLTSVAGITLTADADSLIANGASSTIIRAVLISPRGDAVADGVIVNFMTDLGSFTAQGDKTATATTSGGTGTALVPFMSEPDVVGTATIMANVGGVAQSLQIVLTSRAQETINVVAGPPSAAHMGVAPTFLNIAGQVLQGIICPIHAIVGDRLGNPVLPGTSVAFYTNGGVISPVGTTDALGNAFAEIKTGPPIPRIIRSGDPNFNFITDPRTGFVTIIAVTQGEETFIDSNGNGLFDGPHEFDPNDPELDTPEPFIDHVTRCNGNPPSSPIPCLPNAVNPPVLSGDGQFDPTDRFELFVDGNGNGIWDGPNDVWDANKDIFATTRVLFSGPTVLRVGRLQPNGTCLTSDVNPVNGNPNGFIVPNGGSADIGPFCMLVSDVAGHPLVRGTTISVETTVGAIAGTREVTLPDTQHSGPGTTLFSFTVVDDDAADTDPPQAAEVTVTVTSDLNAECPGGNGSVQISFSGSVD